MLGKNSACSAPASFGFGVKPLEKLDLSRMVNVVEGDAEKNVPVNSLCFYAAEAGDGGAQLAMFPVEQGPILAPGLFRQRGRAKKPVTS